MHVTLPEILQQPAYFRPFRQHKYFAVLDPGFMKTKPPEFPIDSPLEFFSMYNISSSGLFWAGHLPEEFRFNLSFSVFTPSM